MASSPKTRRPSRLRTAAGLARLALYLLAHRSAPLPVMQMNVRVPAGPRRIELAELDQIAGAYGTRVVKRYGTLHADRWFGPVLVEAHVCDDDYTTHLLALADEQRARKGAAA